MQLLHSRPALLFIVEPEWVRNQPPGPRLEVSVAIQHHGPDDHRDHGADDLYHNREVNSSSTNTTINTTINLRAHISRLMIKGELFNSV